jgi:uncharacterized ferredoxin-like protein
VKETAGPVSPMPLVEGRALEKQGVLEAAKMMLVSARTAPKTGGVDDILVGLVDGDELESIAKAMDDIGDERGIEGFHRDANNVRDSDAVVLIGVRGSKKYALDCGACGYNTCNEFEKADRIEGLDFIGPTCLFKALDLGIALGSAVKTAAMLNVDNRIMYRIGAAAVRLRMLPEATVIIGIPVSAKGKSIYYDRVWSPPKK